MKYALLLTLLATPALADIIDVTWTPPDKREDGTALTPAEIKNYRLSWTLNGIEQTDKTVPPGSSYGLDTGSLSGKVCLVLRTVDSDGLESSPTGQVCRNAKPNPPSNVKAK